MSQVLVTESHLSSIASAIRAKNGQSASYTPSQMAAAIQSIQSAGALSIISQTFSSNGSYLPSAFSADAFSGIVVDVPNTYSAADEGKVVTSGALSAQGTSTITSNGTYDTTWLSQIIASISGGGVGAVVPTLFSRIGAGYLTASGEFWQDTRSYYRTDLFSISAGHTYLIAALSNQSKNRERRNIFYSKSFADFSPYLSSVAPSALFVYSGLYSSSNQTGGVYDGNTNSFANVISAEYNGIYVVTTNNQGYSGTSAICVDLGAGS